MPIMMTTELDALVVLVAKEAVASIQEGSTKAAVHKHIETFIGGLTAPDEVKERLKTFFSKFQIKVLRIALNEHAVDINRMNDDDVHALKHCYFSAMIQAILEAAALKAAADGPGDEAVVNAESGEESGVESEESSGEEDVSQSEDEILITVRV
jgi:hypothetical protein